MRTALDLLYKLCGYLAAICLAGIGALIMAQIIGRFFGLLVPSANEIAGFLMAASSFLALAYSFRAGTHIRVNLFLLRLSPASRRYVDILCLVAGTVLMGYFAWYTWVLVQDSIRYKEVSDGLVPVPLAIPQAAMFAGILVLAIAFVDELVSVLRGNKPSYDDEADLVLPSEGH
ncbi:TRAP transporter small permease [Oceanibaculum pacificum]|uniref:TRAP transporter small permease protein n=1 Tax=Oceanibaculum pacificum TaxID=580166 RepID=A0A154WG68_9PROT|nr:TRAP transporter small permease [Oceanibaculum pacificum]KZD12507.1 TRAP dicarboxylate transporter subunit DctQ [Oceanibaculum pacificum]